MNSLFKLLFVLSFILFLIPKASSQEIIWGEIPKEDLEMTVYEPYPEADAVVLGDEGLVTLEFTSSRDVTVLKVHQRIKILKKSAFDRSNLAITYRTDGANRLSNLAAQIISPTGEVTKIKSKQIFKEKITEDLYSKNIAFPNVQEGSIIEYKYERRQEGVNELPTWIFQTDIPVRWSRYRVHAPDWFEYIYIHQGLKLDINDAKVEFGNFFINGRSARTNIIKREFVLKNIPAMKEESYITTMDDYKTRLRFQLKGVNYPNAPYEPVLPNWHELAAELRKSQLGAQYLKSKNYNDIIKEAGQAISPEDSKTQTLEKIFAFVQREMKWDKKHRFYPDNIEDAFKKRSGSSATINTILIALLRHAGIEAYPALMSTRNHGKHIVNYPIIDQFNHLFAYVVLDDKVLHLDASQNHYTPGYLPIEALNKYAWLLKDKSHKWITIDPKQSTEITQTKITINPNGDIEGTINSRNTNYIAFKKRKNYQKKGKDAFIQESLLKELPNASVLDYQVKPTKKNKAIFQDELSLSIPSYAESNGDFLYINPMMNKAYNENPFKLEKRDYPVELPYSFSTTYIFNLKIPEGYEIESLPQSAAVIFDEKDASFDYKTALIRGEVQLVMKMNISETYYTPDRYDSLKQFYDLIVEKHGEQIVLKKK